jgi:phosphohistidine phosphatase
MRLYLIQHGLAVNEEENPARPLTREGREDVQRLAEFLDKTGVEVDHIWHSTKTRAAQTAQIIAEVLKVRELCEAREGLTPNDPIEELVKTIEKIKPEDEIEGLMIVGHLPFLQKLSSYFITGSASAALVQFHPGGAVCLERVNQGPWQFVWGIIPDLLLELSHSLPK